MGVPPNLEYSTEDFFFQSVCLPHVADTVNTNALTPGNCLFEVKTIEVWKNLYRKPLKF